LSNVRVRTVKMGSTKKSERKRHKRKDEEEADGRKRREDDGDEERESKRRQDKEHKSKRKERKEKKHSKRFSTHCNSPNLLDTTAFVITVHGSRALVTVHALYVHRVVSARQEILLSRVVHRVYVRTYVRS